MNQILSTVGSPVPFIQQNRRLLRLLTLASLSLVLALVLLYTAIITPVWAGDADKPLEATMYGTCQDTSGLGVLMAGTGLDGYGTVSGTVNINVPGTVVSATVYYNGSDDDSLGADTDVTFNSIPLSGTLAGGPALWDVGQWSYAYKIDVTALVSSGPGTYTLDGVEAALQSGFATFVNGWELVVLYADPTRKPYAVGIAQGLDLALGSNGPASGPGIDPVVFPFNPAAITRTADLISVAGGVTSSTNPTALYYEFGYGTAPFTSTDIYTTGTLLADNPFQATDGKYWDTYTATVDIPPDVTYLIVQAQSKDDLTPAALEWILQSLALPDACPEIDVRKVRTAPPDGIAGVGDTITFDVGVENIGNTELITVPLVDDFDPAYLDFSNSTPAAPDAQASGVLTWTDISGAGSMMPSDIITYTLSFTGTNPTVLATINTATAQATDFNLGQTPPVTDTDSVEIVADMVVRKKASAIADQGNGIYQVVYQIAVVNGSVISQTYDLTDTFGFDVDFTVVTTPTVTTDAGVTPDSTFTGAAPNTHLASGVGISAEATHTWTITVLVDASADASPATAIDACDPTAPTSATGLYNQTDMVSGGIPHNADACPSGDTSVVFSKEAGAIADHGSGLYSTKYAIVVHNTGLAATTYDLSDAFDFDLQFTVVTTPTVTTDAGVTPDPTFMGSAPNTHLASTVSIGPGATHTWTIEVLIDASTDPDPVAAFAACDPLHPTPGDGLFNEAELTVNGIPNTEDACPSGDVPVIIRKEGSAIAKLANGYYRVSYDIVVRNIGPLATVYDLSDSFGFDPSFNVVGSPTVTTDAGVTPNPGYTGYVPNDGLATAVGLPVGGVHTWTISVDVDIQGQSGRIFDCTVDNPVSGQGFYNDAFVTVNGIPVDEPACPANTLISKEASAIADHGNGLYSVVYEIKVQNTAAISTTYNLTDTFDFDGDFAIVGQPAVSTDAGVTPNPAFSGSAPNEELASGVTLLGNTTHTWTIKVLVDASVDPNPPAAIDACDPGNPTPGTGLFNQSELTVNGVPTTADACPSDGTKVVFRKTAGRIVQVGTDQYRVAYDIVIQNTGTVSTTYNLTDTFGFESVFSVVGQPVVTTNAGVTPNPAFTGSAPNEELASNVTILSTATHTWTIAVVVDTSSAADKVGVCDPNNPVPNTGLYNESELTVNGIPNTEDACPNADTGAIGDYLWYDSNEDGIQDITESGIANVTLELWLDNDGSGVINPITDTLVSTTATGADGGYIFKNLSSGDYLVDVTDTKGILAGYNLTSGPQSQPVPFAYSLAADEIVRDADFGYVLPTGPGTAVVGDTVWYDPNQNGVRDPGETGIPGVTLALKDFGTDGIPGNGDDNVITIDISDINGNYLIANVSPGNYYVDAVAGVPGGVSPSSGAPDPTAPFSVVAGDQYLDADIGYVLDTPSEIAGTVWNDTPNKNGILDEAGSPGFPSVSVDLLDSGGNIIATNTTDTNGDFDFPGLPAGTYQVQVSDTQNVLDDFVPTVIIGGTANGTNKAQPYTVVLPSNTINTTADFGYVFDGQTGYGGIIGNQVWYDVDGNGIFGSGDVGIEGVTVDLLDSLGQVITGTTTGASGDYVFTSRPPGSYQVQVTDAYNILAGTIPTIYPANQTADNSNKIQPYSISLPTDGINMTADFGYTRPAAIGDFVWYDANGNGIQNVGEPGIANVTLDLYTVGIDGLIGTGDDVFIDSTATDADGGYLFRYLPADDYYVDVTDLSGQLSTYTQITTNQAQTDPTGIIPLAVGRVFKDADFGYRQLPLVPGNAIVGDTVWFDADVDGLQQPGEPGIPGVTVNLMDVGPDGIAGTGDDVLVAITTTDETGNYLFDTVPPGTYVVDAISGVPGGLTASPAAPDPTLSFIVAANDQYLDADIGYYDTANVLGEIGDLVFEDVNLSSQFDVGDRALPGVSVDLIRDSNGNGAWDAGEPVIATDTTDETGAYLFTGVPADDYLVHISDTNSVLIDYTWGPLGTPGVNDNSQVDPYSILSFAAGGSNLTADFGFVRANRDDIGVIGNQVWVEFDGDGIFDPANGDVGRAGVTVALLDALGQPIHSTTSGASGDYSFTGLPAGVYSVQITDLFGVLSAFGSAIFPAG
ncbi:MAG: hypothetical protein GXP37_05700 [Chloroflexi bacterium]|nr:hypothetical protein [Chloroflexota bacterium]